MHEVRPELRHALDLRADRARLRRHQVLEALRLGEGVDGAALLLDQAAQDAELALLELDDAVQRRARDFGGYLDAVPIEVNELVLHFGAFLTCELEDAAPRL